jgi:hypothetical protein
MGYATMYYIRRFSAAVNCLAFALCAFTSTALAEGIQITGTYSNLEFSRESGDLNGLEIRVVLTAQEYKATVQFAEGGAADIYIVPFRVSSGIVSFDVPLKNDKPARFKGMLTDQGLTGTIEYPSGASEKVFLPRKRSYWD